MGAGYVWAALSLFEDEEVVDLRDEGFVVGPSRECGLRVVVALLPIFEGHAADLERTVL